MASTSEKPLPFALGVDPTSRDAMLASFRSLEPHLPDLIADFASIGLEGPGIDLGDLIALRADEFLISFEPTDSCCTLFAAVAARDVNLCGIKIEGCHGWPILSCGGETSHDSAAAGLRQSPRNMTAAAELVAFPKTPAVTPPSIIAGHRGPYDGHEVVHDRARHARQAYRVQPIQPIQEVVNDVVRHPDVPHRIDDRSKHVCQSHHGDVILGSRFSVLSHAEVYAA
jgi:hypothetical protein